MAALDGSGFRAVGLGNAGDDQKRHPFMRVQSNWEAAALINHAEPFISEHIYYCGAGQKMFRDDPIKY